MRFQHDIKPVPAAQSEFLRMLRALKRTGRPLILTEGGKPQAVLVDVPSYSVLRDIALLIEVFGEGRERAGRLRARGLGRRR